VWGTDGRTTNRHCVPRSEPCPRLPVGELFVREPPPEVELDRPKVRRRVTGKRERRQPVAMFGGGLFPHADTRPGPGILRRAPPRNERSITLPPGPPMRRELVETSVLVPSQRGQPLWVGYAWNVRALGLGQYACSLCRAVGLGRRQICVQRCNQ
ncbi:unnamed protein product, partial [Cladocopium goreaui]